MTQESAFYRFLTTNDTYDPDRLQVDREKLRAFYLSEGYIDFKVVSAVAELSPEQDAFYITFTVDEGERYKVGKVEIKTSLKDLDPKTLRGLVQSEEGAWYDQGDTDRTVTALTDALGSLGYAFVDVQPRLDRDPKKKTVNLTYDINEGPKVYVERIDIKGNVRTLDKVIRREFRLAEGDAFNTAKLRRTRTRLNNLGFFSSVDIKNLPGSAPDKTILEVDVAEQSTGELSLGLGYSTSDGPLGLAGIRERNLLGKGQDLSLQGQLSGVKSQVQLSFTEPYFMDHPIAVGFDLFDTRATATNTEFTENDIGATIRAGYDISEFLHHTVRYTISLQDIEDVSPTASLAIQQQAGSNLNSVLGNEFLYDRRDNRFDPTEGYYVRLRSDISGPPGDFAYVGTRLGAGYYYSINKSKTVIAGLTGEVGHIQDVGQPVFISNSYQLGGNTFRGFESSGIGPRDQVSGDSLGGKDYFVGTFQVSFPMGLPEEYQVRGHAFTDFGTLTNTDADVGTIQDSASLRLSAGVGVLWKSPFGPIAIDVAIPILKEDFDLTQLINFSVGTTF